jgi:hypothetical protein
MTVVSNTSPLRYLVAAGRADLLAKLQKVDEKGRSADL